MLADPGLVIVKPIEMDQEIHIAVEGEQRVFGQWMKRSEKNARPQKSLGHGIALSRRFVGVAQEANRLKATRAIILGFWVLALTSPVIASLRVIGEPRCVSRDIGFRMRYLRDIAG
jgi:hypothetical protein